jgi:ABC-type multidrug transport system fused ATPase/permease subunit
MKKKNSILAAFRRSLTTLSERERKKVYLIAFIQISMSLLDLLGVLLIGLLGSIAVTGIQSKSNSGPTITVLEVLKIDQASFQAQVLIIGLLAVILLITKTIISVITTRRILFFLSNCGARISTQLVRNFVTSPNLGIQSKNSQEILFATTTGVVQVTMQIIATSVVLLSDLALLLILAIALSIIDPVTAISTTMIFLCIGFLLYKLMHVRADRIGSEFTRLTLKSNNLILEALESFREVIVHNRRSYYSNQIGKVRSDFANISAEGYFMPYISKYVIESAVLLGALLVAGIQFAIADAVQAVSTLAIFMAAGTRIAPSVLRVQQSAILIRTSVAQSKPTLDLIELMNESEHFSKDEKIANFANRHISFMPEIKIRNLGFRYKGTSSFSLKNINLDVPAGHVVAVVGPSAAGKSTLVDCILGIIQDVTGSIEISGLSPKDAIKLWPGAISYVPQKVFIKEGTILENVTIGFPLNEIDSSLVAEALTKASLQEFSSDLMSLEVGENVRI